MTKKSVSLETNKEICFTKYFVKFGLPKYEKHTKFEKNIPHGFDKSADLLSKRQNREEDFFKYVCFSKSPNFNEPGILGENHAQKIVDRKFLRICQSLVG